MSVQTPIAVVELFTSQGCSSCPPADRLLAELAKRAPDRSVRVIPLSFHVDYWNNLGWEDPFSAKDYTRRQQLYARRFGTNRVYTPQMVVNGSVEFVGSNRALLKEAIQLASAKPAELSVAIDPIGRDTPGELKIRAIVSKRDETTAVNVALVERGLSREVSRGENAGAMLGHHNVVRSYRLLKLPTDGIVEVELPINDAVDANQASVVVYVQDVRTLEILGANTRDVVEMTAR